MNRLLDSLRIELCATRLRARRTRHLWRHAHAVVIEQPLDHANADTAMQALDRALVDAACGGLRTTVMLDDAWCRLFMVVAPRNAESGRDCEAAAHLRFHQLYGDTTRDWTLRADWDATRPFLACAIPTALVQGLQDIAQTHRLALLSIQPHFVAAWNREHRTLRAGDWFGVVDSDALMLGIIEQGQLVEVRRLPISAEARTDANWPGLQIAREALRLGLEEPSRIHLRGEIPLNWSAATESAKDSATDSATDSSTAPSTDSATGSVHYVVAEGSPA